MKAPRFEYNKISRLIRVNGDVYAFMRPKLNDFGEPSGEYESIEVKGVFHQTTNHITVIGADASSVQSKQSPAIFALYDAAKGIRQGDLVMINGVQYAVTGTLDVNNWNIAIDISLEAVV